MDQQLASYHQTIQSCLIDSNFVERKFLQAKSLVRLVRVLVFAEHKLRPWINAGSSLGSMVCFLVATCSWTKLQSFVEVSGLSLQPFEHMGGNLIFFKSILRQGSKNENIGLQTLLLNHLINCSMGNIKL